MSPDERAGWHAARATRLLDYVERLKAQFSEIEPGSMRELELIAGGAMKNAKASLDAAVAQADVHARLADVYLRLPTVERGPVTVTNTFLTRAGDEKIAELVRAATQVKLEEAGTLTRLEHVVENAAGGACTLSYERRGDGLGWKAHLTLGPIMAEAETFIGEDVSSVQEALEQALDASTA